MGKNTDQKNIEYGHFLLSDEYHVSGICLWKKNGNVSQSHIE